MVLSSTIANVAVPTVMGAFGVGQGQAQWLATGFVAMMVAFGLGFVAVALGATVGGAVLMLGARGALAAVGPALIVEDARGAPVMGGLARLQAWRDPIGEDQAHPG